MVLVLGPSMTAYLFALPPSKGFISSGNCSIKYSKSIYDYKTCCYREGTKGGLSLGERYCQTCKVTGETVISCEQPELQFRGGTIEPGGGGGVLETQPGPPSAPGKTITPNSGGIFNILPPTDTQSPTESEGNSSINFNDNMSSID